MPLLDPDGPATPDDGIFGVGVPEERAQVVLLAVPYEATVSYGRGTAGGPDAILGASAQLDLFDPRFGRPYEAGIHWKEPFDWVRTASEDGVRQVDRIHRDGLPPDSDAHEAVNRDGLRLRNHLVEEVSGQLAAGRIVGVVGGDHSVPLGSIVAHGRHAEAPFGILHVDAHADLRVAYEGFTYSHASIMERVLAEVPEVTRLVQLGIRDFAESEYRSIEGSGGRVRTWFDADLARARCQGRILSAFQEAVAELPRQVYVSVDIDGLDPALCPHTGTPVPGGLGFAEWDLLIETVVRSGRQILGFDLCEVAPGPAGDEWDGNVGARVLYRLLGWTLHSRRGTGADRQGETSAGAYSPVPGRR
ncbi:MAG TPA: agmatinase family protein [Myxococcales bacterium LLY-WYZ-16_1]|nr:agmatinase family protein [Myxococcales bacterium LLY-WYZ-16_1]